MDTTIDAGRARAGKRVAHQPLWRLGIPDEGWAMYAAPAGERDLGMDEVWQRSLVRSKLRRESAAARRPGLRKGAKAKVAAALLGATLVVPTAQQAQAAPATASHVSGTLKRGDEGSAVKRLQRALGVGVDGVFGPGTEKALKAFQRSNGLAADGVAGPATNAKLGSGPGTSSRASSRSTSSSSSSTSSAARKAVSGLSSSTIRAIQRAIGVTADGEWGPQTSRALKAYQRTNGLEVDGVPGPATMARMGVTATDRDADSSGSSASDSSTSDDSGTSSGSSSSAIAAARAQTGKPYATGGNGPSSFDCSGLTVYAFKKAGVSLPRTSFAQYGEGSSVSKGNVQAGDLVFFDSAGSGASHVGIATSSTSMISATSHGVMEASFASGYWAQHYVGARRL